MSLVETVKQLLTRIQMAVLPGHALSRLAGAIARSQRPWVRNWTIGYFMRAHKPSLADAEQSDPFAYACFDDFFTRKLKVGARTICEAPDTLACPVDGFVSEAGSVTQGQLIQAKGRRYSVEDLLTSSIDHTPFVNGGFATLYLSPTDYHRVHAPCEATIKSMTHVPGKLFPVKPSVVRSVAKLFARNERVILSMDTSHGKMCLIMVGAMIVGSMSTPWHGVVCPKAGPKRIEHYLYDGKTVARAEELGCFHFGSTVIVLTEKPCQWDSAITPASPVRLGQALGSLPCN